MKVVKLLQRVFPHWISALHNDMVMVRVMITVTMMMEMTMMMMVIDYDLYYLIMVCMI